LKTEQGQVMSFSTDIFPSISLSNYSDVRSELRSGDLLFCSGSGVMSQLIQKATHSCWSHVAFVMRLDEIDRVMVVESIESLGVRTIPLSRYLTDYQQGKAYSGGIVLARHKTFSEHLASSQLAALGQFAADQFGYTYDRSEIAKITARILQSALPFTEQEKDQLKSDKEYTCSEYVWRCFREVGIDIDHAEGDYITPADFARDENIDLTHILQYQDT
jgi:Permuted papain-like amidase enzyme, YaeF/YiiX, C92 family